MLEILWIVRAVHILSATAWVGGSIMYQIVIGPALREGGPAPKVAAGIADGFKRMINLCMGLLFLSGGYLVFERLSRTTLGLSYIVVLVLKVAGAIGLFVLALYLAQSNIRRLAKRSTRLSRVAPQLMLALGILVFVLGALLNALFEAAIAPH
ncbi:hypothetical protein EPA93_36680 [Ktedonosporobacter rubrisoli]|uniref:Copper resistance protein D domain-containing protein n=1 Tax=Ktedonosporobacter rubrisoli TaxID=2509675 RepID=A0A4P6JZA1_KTERU|nr:hypothetical protein [Ktedonosporobacter rubrisoli]QBD81218.1 hypothetical protein EPA93_36680 [Ktedonosporobacter rubrisoli]